MSKKREPCPGCGRLISYRVRREPREPHDTARWPHLCPHGIRCIGSMRVGVNWQPGDAMHWQRCARCAALAGSTVHPEGAAELTRQHGEMDYTEFSEVVDDWSRRKKLDDYGWRIEPLDISQGIVEVRIFHADAPYFRDSLDLAHLRRGDRGKVARRESA